MKLRRITQGVKQPVQRHPGLMKLGYWWKILRKKEVYFPIQIKKTCFRAGNIYSSWTVCPDNISSQSVVLSFGAGLDISWEITLAKQYGCRIYLFDPTQASIEWISKQELPQNITFYPFGISDRDGMERFYLPDDAGHISASILYRRNESRYFEGEVHTLERILEIIDTPHVDILKMDIEGAEYKIIKSLVPMRVRPQQILIEFHHRFPGVSLSDTRNAVKTLNDMGYKIFYISPNGEEYSFIHDRFAR